VRPALFTITCTTCHVRLAVRSAEVIGAILACPKCGCMVPVVPPEGWQPPKLPDKPAEQSQAVQSQPGEGQGEGSSSQSIASTNTSAVGVKGIFPRLFHSWYPMVAIPAVAAAIVIVVWLTMFSKSGVDNSAAPAVKQSATAPVADATVNSERKDENPPATEQPATIDKNKTTAAVAINPNNKADAKPGAENSTESKPQPDSESSDTKIPEAKTPEVKTPEATTSETESPPNKQEQKSSPQDIGTSKLVKLVAPEQLDPQSRLGDVIANIEFRDMPFARAIGLAAALSGLPITIDPDAMALLQVSPRDPITLRLTNTTVEEILREIVAKRGMVFVAEDGQIVVTSPADQNEKLRRLRYTVSDLTDNDKATTDHFAKLLQKLISPDSWQAAGGQGTMETEQTALIVTQTGAVHDQILVFCEKLRNARGRPLKSKLDPKRFQLATRLQQAESALNREVTANFHEPATLMEILAYLAQQAEVDILVDRQALGNAGLSDKSELSFVVENQPLAVALNDLLNPLKLGYRPIDAHTLQVTTQSSLDARLELEFYPVGKILSKEVAASDLIEQIKTKISPASWTNAGSSAAIYFDPPSSTLIVLQSPPVQAAIQVFLNKIPQNQK